MTPSPARSSLIPCTTRSAVGRRKPNRAKADALPGMATALRGERAGAKPVGFFWRWLVIDVRAGLGETSRSPLALLPSGDCRRFLMESFQLRFGRRSVA